MDHAKKALSRVYWQYRDSLKLNEWMRILPDLAQANLEAPLGQIINLLDIEAAQGDQLDIIGRIAGIPRPRILTDSLKAFGYNGTLGAQPYGTAPYKDPTLKGINERGLVLGDILTPDDSVVLAPVIIEDNSDALRTILLPDYLFRIMVRAKIRQNNGSATIDDVKQSVDFIFGTDSTVTDGQDMTMSVTWLEGEVTDNFRALIEDFDIIPRPQGVKTRVKAIKYYAFAYKGTFNAQPYGAGRYAAPF